MKKISLIISFLVVALFIFPRVLSAQELTETDYEKLGEEWMETMMGDQHEAMDKQMQELMGEDFLRQMHIAMGKRSQSPGSFGMMPMMGMVGIGGAEGTGMMDSGNFRNMMGANQWPLAASTKFGGLHVILAVVTWLSFIAFLMALTRYFWKKGNK